MWCGSLLRGAQGLLGEPLAHLPLDATVDEAVHVKLLPARTRVHHASLVWHLLLVEAHCQCHLDRATCCLVVAVGADETALLRVSTSRLRVHEDCDPCIG